MTTETSAIAGMLRALAGPRHVGRGSSITIGLIGRGIQLSRTPAMHEMEARRLGLDCVYHLLDFDRFELTDAALGEVVETVADAGFAGVNVTHPFKQAVLPFVDELSTNAASIGAVNTLVFRDGHVKGHNTDCWGFAESFRDGLPGAPVNRVAQFGAGGAGVAVARALADLGVRELVVVDNDPPRATALADRMNAGGSMRVETETDHAAAVRAADGIVNCTPVGMAKYPGTPFARELLSPRHWVADIIYFPAETELLRIARERGCRVLPGAGMAVYQAVRAFELFTGRAADKREMVKHFGAAA
ncbi:MAG: shikimate dehydrogenase [Mesorhizobium sp.]|nr:shikimate dehydrogenase [Mesorhizobium sp.]MCO5161403.1 shikimate dehydrogenase [Mesorhizobium sp.]